MPALAHIGLGLAAKKVDSKMNVGYLIIGAEAVEIVYMALWALGIEHPPTADKAGFSNYSHSVLGGFLITLIVGGITYLLTKNKKHTLVMALLALSHTVMDVIASPMTAFFPMDQKKHVFFSGDWTIGLGLWRYKVLANSIEYGFMVIGILIYILTKIKLKKQCIPTK